MDITNMGCIFLDYNIIINVERDAEGNLTHIHNAHESATSHLSMIHCEIAYQDSEDLAALQQMLLNKIDTLDWNIISFKLQSSLFSLYPRKIE